MLDAVMAAADANARLVPALVSEGVGGDLRLASQGGPSERIRLDLHVGEPCRLK
jgi:hypothetical protein